MHSRNPAPSTSATAVLQPFASYRKQPPPFIPLRGDSITAQGRGGHSVEGKTDSTRPPIPAIVVRLATEDGGYAKPASAPTSRSTSVDVKQSQFSQSKPSVANTQKRKSTRKAFTVLSPGASAVFCASLCQSPEPRVSEVTAGLAGPFSTPSNGGKGKGGVDSEEPKRDAPSLRCDAQLETTRVQRPRDTVLVAGGTDTPCHTQSPASTKPRRSASMKDGARSPRADPNDTSQSGIPARDAALPPAPAEAHSFSGKGSARTTREAHTGRPLTPLSIPVVSPPDFLSVPIHGPQRRQAYPNSIDSRESETSSSHPSPFSRRSAHHTSNTSRGSAKSPTNSHKGPHWIGPSPPSPLLTPPSHAFSSPSSVPIRSPTLRRLVCTSVARSDPSLLTLQEVKKAKEGMGFSIPTRDERESGKAGGRVDPVNGCYVEVYDPERPPTVGRAVRELRVPERLEGSDRVDVSYSEGEDESTVTPKPGSSRFLPLSKESPQYVETQRKRSFLRRKQTMRLQVDRNDPGWPLVDLKHWDMNEVSVMTEEDHRKRDQRIEEHVPCGPEEEDRDWMTPSGRLYVTNPDEGNEFTTKTDANPERGQVDTEPDPSPEKGQVDASQPQETKPTGSWIDQMTMRSLFKLLEQTLKASQKVR